MYAIGTDIVKISRIEKLSLDNKFVDKIFSKKELDYCNSYKNFNTHLAGKYAGKEAVKKAVLSKSLLDNISLKRIEILNNTDKSPYISIDGLNNLKCEISISHDSDYAIAFVLIEI